MVTRRSTPSLLGRSSSRSSVAAPGTTVTYTHRVTNAGTLADTYQLGAISSQGWVVTSAPASLAYALWMISRRKP